ncbi:ligase-associated DNA damage response DEXH box helicase [Ottowia sp.]|uniref:ligase-associated DNA damage response DEXH box helicase n=1 Tax=Ottowia sp. TaxID=1898956 RepID=UPI002BA78F2C|nr:ligase-associated DNA damage response DEXH box helicase [Ottowia sp.]HOB67083.1 ligase-associated DNA damage response DEXH box helicase [Ottowia sp.]HPZ56291.1 ligase-associated DNA damage response DEXH box helicase [Ottowia sp.]HQD47534.1 ligase-associated DNA damage response DEXH box helicase [Ottowia sp.]
MARPSPSSSERVDAKFGRATDWLATRGQRPFPFQLDVWQAIAEGRSGLLHATTGAGKTLAVWLGALMRFVPPALASQAPAAIESEANSNPTKAPPLTVLWLTPMRALAADTLRALRGPLADLAPHWTSGLRTGDTTSGERAAQSRRLPTVLVTTPESLSLLLARADAREALQSVQLVVADEWHELLGSKRGVQVQLALARLSGWNPQLMVWGMSATLGNLQEALQALLPRQLDTTESIAVRARPASARGTKRSKNAAPPSPALVQGRIDKPLVIDTLLPARAERFAWAGHMGLQMLPQVIEAIEGSGSTLVFTNTRSQAERWYQALIEARPDLAGVLALHHGSLDKSVRDWVELGLKEGRLKAVVATSSLDLGVDFLPVERVLQIGSCKGVARLLQRAGRSGHAPGRTARITLVPTHSLEIVEGAAAREAVQAGQIESRHSPQAPLDVLVQHLVTVALGGGFTPDALLAEVRRTAAYARLTDDDWRWCLDFVRQGGPSLAAYPDFHRVLPDAEGVWRVPDARLARRHRANIGTIVSDAAMSVQYVGGARLGTVEESFIARLKPGDVFMFAGRLLELVRVHEMTAQVRRAPPGHAALPRWNGGRMPLSSTLADAVVRELAAFEAGTAASPELAAVAPLLKLQQRWSRLPVPGTLLAETLKSREGWHLFLYPFAGRVVHMGLAGLLAWRAAQGEPGTFSLAFNDYGLELLSAKPIDWAALLPTLIALPDEAPPDQAAGRRPALLAEVLGSINAGELARRRFREIARIAGLIFQSHPGEQRSSRQLQASASLYYEVFQKYDPGNRLLLQAEGELLRQELDIDQLAAALTRMQAWQLALQPLQRPTPFAFPLMVERFRERLTNEPLADRIARMVADLERAAGNDGSGDATAPDAETVGQALRLADESMGRKARQDAASEADDVAEAGQAPATRQRVRRPRQPRRS